MAGGGDADEGHGRPQVLRHDAERRDREPCREERHRREAGARRCAWSRKTPAPVGATADSLTKNLLHGLALGKLIDELVQLANLLHQRILDLLHADTADHAFDP